MYKTESMKEERMSDKNKCNMSRRNFMALAGGALGAVAMASVGMSMESEGRVDNIPDIDINSMEYEENETDVLVIGSGLAGLFAAVKAHDAGSRVIMVSKGGLGTSGQTPFARGLFAFDPASAGMSLDEYVASVSRAAVNTNNPVFTRQMAEHSVDRMNELRSWGFFDSALYKKAFSKPLKERNIALDSRIMITHLIKENDKIAGAAGFSLDSQKIYFYTAKSVILCTGAGGFKPNGFPICDLTHDGTVMAYKIGAKITGKEWNDGHSANKENPASVYSQWGPMLNMKPSLTGVGIVHNLGVDMNYRAYVNGADQENNDAMPSVRPKDVSGGPPRPAGFEDDGPPRRRDDGRADKGERMPPPGRMGAQTGGASAGMSIHKSEGLVPMNEFGESSIKGLYAAGDALGSHMAGGIYTQNGSSMTGSAVQGAVAGEAAAAFAKETVMPVISTGTSSRIKDEILAPLKRKSGYSAGWVTQTLQGIMIPNFVLYIKKERMMQAALVYVEELRDHHSPMLVAKDMHELRLAHETANMILNAEMKLRASIMRKESRGSHYRTDFPETDTENWNAWINIYRDKNGFMKLEKQPFGSWPAA